jgi:hypothetical protein
MQALVDTLDFRETDNGRHSVTLEKRLVTSPRLRLLPTDAHAAAVKRWERRQSVTAGTRRPSAGSEK